MSVLYCSAMSDYNYSVKKGEFNMLILLLVCFESKKKCSFAVPALEAKKVFPRTKLRIHFSLSFVFRIDDRQNFKKETKKLKLKARIKFCVSILMISGNESKKRSRTKLHNGSRENNSTQSFMRNFREEENIIIRK